MGDDCRLSYSHVLKPSSCSNTLPKINVELPLHPETSRNAKSIKIYTGDHYQYHFSMLGNHVTFVDGTVTWRKR